MEDKSKKKRKILKLVIFLVIVAVAGAILGVVVAGQNRGETWNADTTGGEGNDNAVLDLD